MIWSTSRKLRIDWGRVFQRLRPFLQSCFCISYIFQQLQNSLSCCFLDLSKCLNKPKIGDIVRVIPNHVCVAVNMVDQLVAVRGNEIVDVIPVVARGRLV